MQDISCKHPCEVTQQPDCEAHEDKIEREMSSNFDNDDTCELLATRVNRTGLWFPTEGNNKHGLNPTDFLLNKHGLNCIPKAIPRVLKFVSWRFHCDIVNWNGFLTLRCRNLQDLAINKRNKTLNSQFVASTKNWLRIVVYFVPSNKK